MPASNKLTTMMIVTVYMMQIVVVVISQTDLNEPLLLSEEQAKLISSTHRELTSNESATSKEIDEKSFCLCGLSNKPKIVGGTETAINEFPWMAFILIRNSKGTYLCGGFLVTDHHVITAAHCMALATPDDITVFLGDHNITDSNEASSIRVNASIVKIHPEYNKPARHENDIAIITLKYSVRFAYNIHPICLPLASLNYAGMIGTIAGWGRTHPNTKTSTVLLSSEVPILSNAKCGELYEPFSVKITSKMLCAGRNGSDACQGDSGGPLMITARGRYFAVGVVSFGVNCGVTAAAIPGAYTRVDKFLQFIVKNTIVGKKCY